MRSARKRLTSAQIIILGFAGVILFGSVLLMLPIATRSGDSTSFADAVFTATSAVCVTGLVVHDTATYWSGFGQAVILLLIQIGGMGVVTVAVAIATVSGRKISLKQRSLMQEAIAAPKVGGIVRLTGFIIQTTAIIELVGTTILSTVFCPRMGFWKGIWYSLFHAVSAFCNAGFDLMGFDGEYSSLTGYVDNPVLNLTVMALIIVGGIGFLTWDDIRTRKFHFHQYRMQSKIIIMATAVLLLTAALYFYFFEFSSFAQEERIWSSLFQAVTPRTAGFNTTDLTLISETGVAILIILMMIGGSPGSTAGGMKTTTAVTLLATAIAVFCRKESTQIFRRRVMEETIRQAVAIVTMYLLLFLSGGFIISKVEGLPLLTCLFETASAIGTVGLTLGITPQLEQVSRTILILLMFLGRVGGLTLIFAALSAKKPIVSKCPVEKVIVG